MTLALHPPPTLDSALRWGARQLRRVAEQPQLEAQVLLADTLGVERTWLLAHPEAELGEIPAGVYRGNLARRADGVPLPYVLGWWEFYGRRFRVTPHVLIPRPETETLVEHGLDWLTRRAGPSRVLDIGTGSGCIGVSLAVEAPNALVVATDLSAAALGVARENAARHGVGPRLSLVRADLAAGLAGGFDLLCANLPYLPTAELPRWAVSRWEPRKALDGGAGGTQVIERLLPTLPNLISPSGMALLEIGEGQDGRLLGAVGQTLPGWRARPIPDLAGVPRVIEIQRDGA
jgi:release factor glutamine methyltransferase